MSLLPCIVSLLLLVTVTHSGPILNNDDVPKKIDSPQTEIKYRLETNVKPATYNLEITANIDSDDNTFLGKVGIIIHIVAPTKEIKLHAKNLMIDETLTSILHTPDPPNRPVPVPKPIKPTKHSYDEETDFLTLTFAELLMDKKYLLSFEYTGIFHDDKQGFYKGSYTTDYGEKVPLAMTQFEPTHARRAFPCFDEPAFKAKFNITITHSPQYTAVSNTPVVRIEPVKDEFPMMSTNFEVTPKMSTYLVAFVVSDFKVKSSEDGTFRVWARENAIHTSKYALGIGPKALKYLADLLGKKPLAIGKMDNFALPEFKAGAMENWGIVTYRETGLLYEENVTTTAQKQAVAAVISHEFAHQWFGNLVTPAWWDDVWLSEGFANYFEYYTTDKIEPTWRLMDRFVVKNLQESAFTADDNVTQHMLDATVNSPAEISAIFDTISYSKGGCVIRMISHAITEPVFQTALKQYLSVNEYQQVTSRYLMRAFAEEVETGANKPTIAHFQTWTKQAGYPVITVTRNYKTGVAVIKQERFLTKKPSKPQKEIWSIPLTWTTQNRIDFTDTSTSQWLHEKERTISGFMNNKWAIFNKQQTGYYRVNYDEENWKLISDYLKTNESTKIHTLNRAQLLDDSFHLVQAGYLEDYTPFLEISQYLQQEDDYAPWHAAHRAFSVLDKALANTKEHRVFKLYVLHLIEKLETKLGYRMFNNDSDVDVFNRLNVISLACAMGSPKCLEDTHNQLRDHVSGTMKIPTDLRNAVYCAGLRSDDMQLWGTTYDYAMDSKNEKERDAIVSSLGCTSNVDNLNFYLHSILSPNFTISRDSVFQAVNEGSSIGAHVAFDFIKEKLNLILEADSGNINPVVKYLNAIGRRMTTDENVEQLKAFIEGLKKEHPDLAERLTKEALKFATDNAAWLKKYETNIEKFLNTLDLIPPQEVTTSKPDSSSISMPTFSLIAFVTLLGSGVTRAYGL